MSLDFPQGKLTHQQELDYANFITRKFNDKCIKANARFKHIIITDVSIKINQPGMERGRNIFQRMFGKGDK